MDHPAWDYDAFAERVTEWGKDQQAIRAALVFGSRARDDRPADIWSDIDIVLITTDPDRYRDGTEWLSELGDPVLSCGGTTPVGGFTQRHVVFDDGLEVDFVPVSGDEIAPLERLPDEVLEVLARGYRVLVDKDDIATAIDARLEDVDVEALALKLPPEAEFVETLHDGWYHAFWVAKKLRRGELWSAKRGLDGYIKRKCLLPLLTWHARAVHGRQSWHAGRFLEEWADERALKQLEETFARYDEADCWRALFATMRLLRRLAREMADDAGYEYPEAADERMTDLIEDLAPR